MSCTSAAAIKDYFYPRPPWGGRRPISWLFCPSFPISIHALRGEGDFFMPKNAGNKAISIHALRGEGDIVNVNRKQPTHKFLSTPSVGRATIYRRGQPCSIHRFLSTPSVGRATPAILEPLPNIYISIHALRGEGDAPVRPAGSVCANFYPRPPWGGRPPEKPVRCRLP